MNAAHSAEGGSPDARSAGVGKRKETVWDE
jgi:hypothetical protein